METPMQELFDQTFPGLNIKSLNRWIQLAKWYSLSDTQPTHYLYLWSEKWDAHMTPSVKTKH